MRKKKSVPGKLPFSKAKGTSSRKRDSLAKKAAPGTSVKSTKVSPLLPSKSAVSSRKKITPEQPPPGESFPLVGIGASAGGLEALLKLLEHLPADIKMAFVFVQHLAPEHESMLTEIVAKASSIPIKEVREGMPIEINHIYVIPPNTNMAVENGILRLRPRTETRGQHMPINYFFQSLAENYKNRAIGVILSGTASDGTQGLKAIKAEGGITFAQDEKSAKYSGMPQNAIAAGVVDIILSPEGIARELARISRHPHLVVSRLIKKESLIDEGEDIFHKIFFLMRNATGADFSQYKLSTIKRRIARRMDLHRLEQLTDYLQFLKNNSPEIKALYDDLLINVTNFFRDPETFEVLKRKIFPALLKEKPPKTPIRVWVPGCSTGEEAYSLAIVLIESLGNKAADTPIQIFAADLSESAIEKARAGVYPESEAENISPERLRRFFIKIEEGYQIKKVIRDLCVFARQDLTKDPPFSRIDFISCRNVLIYMEPALQRRVVRTFHFALKQGGRLMLGVSESTGGHADLFMLADKKHKIYTKKVAPQQINLESTVSPYLPEKAGKGKAAPDILSNKLDLQKTVDQLIMTRFALAGVLVNENLDILQFRGHTGYYLEPPPGAATLNLLKMVRPGLLPELRTAIHEAKKRKAPVRKSGLQIKFNGEFREVNLEVVPIRPLPASQETCYFVMFEGGALAPWPQRQTGPRGKKPAGVKLKAEQREIDQLHHELDATKEYLETVTAQQDAINEELRSLIEELQSSNEELQSTNEELETAKEELQSTNEELITVNEELQNRNLELNLVNNDISNLLSSVNIPVVMLGNDLRVRRFTLLAEKLLNLIATDVGRPFSDLRINIDIAGLDALIKEVQDTLTTKEMEVRDREGHWYSLRMRPYKTIENKIDGVVMVLLEIDELKHHMERLTEAYNYAQAIVETVRQPLIILDADLRVKTANNAFYHTFQVQPQETEKRYIYNIGAGQWNIPQLRKLLEEILPQRAVFENFEVDAEFPRVGRKRMRLNARRLQGADESAQLILLAMEEEEVPGHRQSQE